MKARLELVLYGRIAKGCLAHNIASKTSEAPSTTKDTRSNDCGEVFDWLMGRTGLTYECL